MEVKKFRKHIPEQWIDTTEYISFDGKSFSSADECSKYEKQRKYQLKIESHPVFRSKRFIDTWPEEDSACMYYLGSKEDHVFLLSHTEHGLAEQDDFSKFGPGFYLMVVCDNGDYPPTYRLHQIDYYIHLLETEFQNWKDDVQECKDSIISSIAIPNNEEGIKYETYILQYDDGEGDSEGK